MEHEVKLSGAPSFEAILSGIYGGATKLPTIGTGTGDAAYHLLAVANVSSTWRKGCATFMLVNSYAGVRFCAIVSIRVYRDGGDSPYVDFVQISGEDITSKLYYYWNTTENKVYFYYFRPVYNEVYINSIQSYGSISVDGVTTIKELATYTGKGTYSSDMFAPAGYGLGTMGKTCTDCNTATKSGFYSLSGANCLNTPPSYANMKYGAMIVLNRFDSFISQTIVYLRYITIRYSNDGGVTWTEWEHLNPPMVANTEYRTVERYKESAVYKKVDTNGNILWRKDGESQWHLLSSADYVATATVE